MLILLPCYKCGKQVDTSNVFEAIDLGGGRAVCTDCDRKIAVESAAAMAERNKVIDKLLGF